MPPWPSPVIVQPFGSSMSVKRHRAAEARLDRPDGDLDLGRIFGVALLLQLFATGNRLLQDFRVQTAPPTLFCRSAGKLTDPDIVTAIVRFL
jgi:hypothetical protein